MAGQDAGGSGATTLRAPGAIDYLLATDAFEATFECARVGLAILDLEGRFLRVNEAYAELTGSPPEDLVGQPLTGDPAQLAAMVAGELPTAARVELEIRAGTWVLQGVTLRHGPDGRPCWFVVDAQDVSDRRRAQDALAHLALHDALTGLPNRVLALDRLRLALALAERSQSQVGVLFCDLDGFKAVNDQHGHLLGDVVLQVVARRLVAAVRPSDTVARLGGDEFVVVLAPPVSPAELDALAERLRAAVGAPLREHGTDTRVGLSVGRALSRPGDLDPHVLLAAADAAMYAAKRARRAGDEPPT